MATTVEIGRMIIRLMGDASHYERMLQNMQAQSQSAAAAITRLGAGLTAGLTIPLAGMGIASLNEFAKFDHAMANSMSIMKVSDEQMARLRGTAFDLASILPKAPDDLARSYFYLASAGYDTEQSIKLLPAMTRFAVAGMFDLERATTLASDAQSALGMRIREGANAAEIGERNLKNLTRVTDVLAKANYMSNADIRQFSIAITSQGGAAAKAFGKDIEEAVAVLAAFADQGIKAELAGTNLSRVIRILGQSTVKHRKAHEKYGIAVFDEAGKFRNIADIVGDMEKAFGGMSDEQRTFALAEMGFEARIQQAILPLMKTSNLIRKYEADLRNAGGTTQEIADKQMKSFTNQMMVVWNTVKIVAIEIGEVLAPFVMVAGQVIKWLATQFHNLSPFVKGVIVILGVVAAAIGPVLMIIGVVGPAISTVLGVLAAGWAAISSVAVPVLSILIPLLAELAIGMTLLAVYTGSFSAAWELVKSVVGSVITWITGKVNEFIKWIRPVWQAQRDLVIAVWQSFRSVFVSVVDFIYGYLQKFIEKVVEVWNYLETRFGINWTNIRDEFIGVMIAMEFAITNFRDVVNFAATATAYHFIKAFKEVEYFFDTVLPAVVVHTFNSMKAAISNGVNLAKALFTNLPGPIADSFSALFEFLMSSFKAVVRNMVQNAKDVFSNLKGLITGTISFDDIWAYNTDVIKDKAAVMAAKMKEIWKDKDPLAGFTPIVPKLEIPEREIHIVEKKLKELYDKEGAALRESFAQFKAKKWAEWMMEGLPPDVAKPLEDIAKEADVVGKHVDETKHKMQEMDSVFAGSAEAKRRLENYRDAMGIAHGGPKVKVPKTFDEKPKQPGWWEVEQVDILKQIRDAMNKARIAPDVIIAVAGLS